MKDNQFLYQFILDTSEIYLTFAIPQFVAKMTTGAKEDSKASATVDVEALIAQMKADLMKEIEERTKELDKREKELE